MVHWDHQSNNLAHLPIKEMIDIWQKLKTFRLLTMLNYQSLTEAQYDAKKLATEFMSPQTNNLVKNTES